jgi:hypothetical protein
MTATQVAEIVNDGTSGPLRPAHTHRRLDRYSVRSSRPAPADARDATPRTFPLLPMNVRLPPARTARALLALLLVFSAASLNSASKPSMSSQPEFSLVTVPSRIADLEFTYLRPANFQLVDLPAEKPSFDDPTAFYPLQVIMANYGAVIFSVVARPAFDDGSIEDWAQFLAQKEKIEILSMTPGVIAGMPALIVEALNPTEAGPMRFRTALLEDGKRYLNISVMAPEAIWKSVEPTLQTTMASFRLAEPRGSTTPLTRAEARKIAVKAPAKPGSHAVTPASNSDAGESSPMRPAELALADDAGTLDPEHPLNVRMRDNGAGLTARTLETNPSGKYAVVGAGAIVGTFQLPFGWHVIDDGRRTLVFDAGGKIQISLNLRRDDGNSRAMLEKILAQACLEQPQIDPLLVDFAPDMPGLVLRNYRDGGDVLVQAFVVKHLRDDGLAHVARVTAAPDDMSRAMNLAEVILRSLGPVLVAR